MSKNSLDFLCHKTLFSRQNKNQTAAKFGTQFLADCCACITSFTYNWGALQAVILQRSLGFD